MGAATSEEYPILDGIAPSWADIVTTINVSGGGVVQDIDYAAINTGSVLEIGEQRGASGGRVIRRTTGAKTDTASITYYMTGYRKLVRKLMEVAPTRGNQVLIGLVTFDLHIQYTPPGEVDIWEMKVKGGRLIKRDWSTAEGVEADKIEVDISVAEVVDIIDSKEVVLI